MNNPRADVATRQYERFRYPEPIQDLEAWLRQLGMVRPEPRVAGLWRDREYKRNLDILIAGCGTNQASVFAFANPDAKVVAVYISQLSVDQKFARNLFEALWRLDLWRGA